MSHFRGYTKPEGATAAGYAWLIARYALRVPVPPIRSAIAGQHRPCERDGWSIKPEQYAPDDTAADQLSFALQWEGVNLAVLSALFRTVQAAKITAAVRATPSGAQTRRLWFLYEWLTGERLDLPDAGKVAAVNVLNSQQQFALPHGEISTRHRVRNNLPGTRDFCPLVKRTPALDAFAGSGLSEKVKAVTGAVHPDVMARAAAFLLLSGSRASFHIEGEKPARDRTHRWAQSIAAAGATALSIEAFEQLQRLLIGDDRFVHLGLRTQGGFVGTHDSVTQEPLPDHVDARHEDLRSLVNGIVRFDERAGRGAIDAVVAAAFIGFGFAYVHPFEDGNGRLHRWLMHHVLSAAGFAPAGIVFPVSAVMLREISTYKQVLASYSKPLLPCIQWTPTANGNVEVLNETGRVVSLLRCHGARRAPVLLRTHHDRIGLAVRGGVPEGLRRVHHSDRVDGGHARAHRGASAPLPSAKRRPPLTACSHRRICRSHRHGSRRHRAALRRKHHQFSRPTGAWLKAAFKR